MKIYVNGEALESEETTLQQWLQNQGINLKEIVVEYNGKILVQEQWVETYFHEGDQLEILRFVGGG